MSAIIVVNYNNQRFLAVAIDGALSQEYLWAIGEADTPSQVVAAAPAVLGLASIAAPRRPCAFSAHSLLAPIRGCTSIANSRARPLLLQ